MENVPHLIEHIGDGNFNVTLEDDNVVSAGSNLCGMIRYTYFEDFTIPEIGWKITQKQLTEDYFPKVLKDIQEGKINFKKTTIC